MTRIFKYPAIAILLLGCMWATGQTLTCPSPYFYYGGPGGAVSGSITGYNPVTQATINTGIPNPPNAGNSLALLPALNGGTFSPTFYTSNGTYYYYDGTAWVNTGHTSGSGAAVNPGGCNGFIFNIAATSPPTVYAYNGSGNGTAVAVLPGGGYVADLVTDCNCNFYVLNASTNPQVMMKFTSAGVLLSTYTLTGLPVAFGGAGFAIIGNTVYYPNSFNWYAGTMGPGLTISFSLIPSIGALGIGDFASCPFSAITGTITASLSQLGFVCPGQSATVVATTTASPATYSWSGPGITGAASLSAVTVSAAGVYTCFIDNQACPAAQDTFTISVASGPCISVTSNSITCASLGSATVSPTPGSGPYTYTWLPTNQTGSVATGLSPGNYTVLAFDPAANLTFTNSVVFTSLIPLTGTLSSSPSISCNGAATGTAAILNITGGSGAQNYLWVSGATAYTVPNPQNLSGGLWTYTVTDALTGCTIANAFFISQPPPLTFTLSSASASTCAGSSVALSGTVSGGTPPAYSYTWSGGAAGAATYAPVQNTAGNYTYSFNAMDSYSCLAVQTLTVDVAANPTLVVASTSICPLQTGTLVVAGASTYSWNGLAGTPFFTDNPLVSTAYTVTGNSAGCISSASASITLLAPPSPAVLQNSPLCQGAALVLSINSASLYSWSGPAGFASSSQNNTLSPVAMNQAGIYQVTITAANSCTNAAAITVTVYPTPTLSATGSTVCTSQTMSLNASSNPGASFLWTGPQSFTSTLQNILIANPSVNQSGNYTAQATSANGCTNVATINAVIVVPPGLAVSLSSTSLCAQALSGSPNTLTLTSAGASSYTLVTPPHVNNTNPSGPSSPVSMLPPYQITGPVTATLLGSNGVCTVSTTAGFFVVANPTVSISNPTPVICAGQSFTYTSSGADSYTWSAANPGNTLYANGGTAVANPGINSVFSVSGGSLGCNSALQSSTITVNPLPVLTINPNPALVCLGNAVALTASGTGTLYSWSPGSWLDVTNSATVHASPPNLQNYLVVSSLNSCTISAVLTVSVLTLPVAVISAGNATVCMNQHIVMTGTSNINGSYSWMGPSGLIISGPELDIAAISTAYSGAYTLTVNDGYGCKGSAVEPVLVRDLPTGSFASSKLQGCVPFDAALHFVPGNSSAPAQSMSWQVNGIPFSGPDLLCTISAPGSYPIAGTVVDQYACANTFSALITGWAQPVADFYFSPEKPVEGLDEVQFTDASENASSFKWYFGSNTSGSLLQNPRFLFETTGTFPIALIVSNAQGCSDTIVKPLVVLPDFSIYVPNAFTPNADGLNDLFGPVIRGARSYHLLITNRWGESIFQTGNLEACWDGSFKGQPCKEDVYIWMIEVSSETYSDATNTKKLTGEVLLYR